MQIPKFVDFLLIAMVLKKELSYFTPQMIYAYKSVLENIVFVFGIFILIMIIIRFAVGFFDTCLGCAGIAMMAVMWLKQGVSRKGVLTIAHFGQEFYAWDEIAGAKIVQGDKTEIRWMDKDKTLICKQKYTEKNSASVLERMKEQGISVQLERE